MRLSHPFFQLPVLFEAERLQAEVAALPAAPDGMEVSRVDVVVRVRPQGA